MSSDITTRRRFLVAAIAGSGAVVSGINLTLLQSSAAWAEALDNDSGNTETSLAQMVRLYYPHDNVADSVYEETVDSILSAAAADEQLKELLDAASAALDEASDGSFSTSDDATQLAAMIAIQGEAVFTAIRFQVLGRFYAHPEVWKAINYPGSSVEHGGYVDRGFNDIDWLPEEGR
jgi:hypothetical protein